MIRKSGFRANAYLQPQSRRSFFLGSRPPPMSDSRLSRLEIPLLSLASLGVSGYLFFASLDKSVEGRGTVSVVSVKEFLDDYLKPGRVSSLYLSNKDHIDACILPVDQTANDAAGAGIIKALQHHLRAVLGPRQSFRNPPAKQTHSRIRFRLGDPSHLDCLLSAYSASPPPVHYMPKLESFTRWQKTLLLTSALAVTTWSFVARPAVSIAASKMDLLDSMHNAAQQNSQQNNANTTQPDKLMKFGQSHPKSDVPDVSFADVAGLSQAKLEIKEFVEFLKHPEKFRSLGANVPKGALLVGPPGTGKTLLAKAVAGEAKVPFYSTSGSDFIEMFVGVGSSRIRDLFEKARNSAPSIVFIDEIDTIGRNRSNSSHMGNGGTDERESTLNALLVELDGFNSSTNIVTLAGTNRGDILDPALTRPGRFDRRIALSKPSIQERMAIFDIHLKPIKLDSAMSRKSLTQRLAALTPGFSGAEIKSVCNEAAILAARRDANAVNIKDFETAVERLIGGLKHSGDVLDLELKNHVAVHEAGHAICGWFLAEADPILKLSIVPRANGALGYTQMLPDDMLLSTKESLEDKIAVLLGGRAAEHLFCNALTTGASDDLERAMRLCRAYVCSFGFDKVIGLRSYGYDSVPMGTEIKNAIEQRIQVLLKSQWERCLALLETKKNEVAAIAELLMEKEVISYRDLERVLGKLTKKISDQAREFVEALPCGF